MRSRESVALTSLAGRHGDRHRRRLSPLSALATTAVTLTVVTHAVQPSPSVQQLVTQRMGFQTGDVQRLERGDAVVRSLDTRVPQELAHVGVVFVDADPEEFVARFRDIEQFERGPQVLQMARFGTPPRIEDLQSLRLSAEDFAELPKCRPGQCEMKLSAVAMDRFRNEVDWSSAQAWDQADEVTRRMLLGMLLAYQAEGNAALGDYFDHRQPLPVAEQFRALLASRDALPAPVPLLFAYLDHYPRGLPDGAEEFFYWSTVDFGLKPTIRLNHVIIYPQADRASTGVAFAIANKQLYASHYFHSALELRFVVDRALPSGGSGAALISVARSRTDGITGLGGSLLRPIVRRRSREALRSYLEQVKQETERPGVGTP